MPKYTLTYFDLPGRGEAIRLCFAVGGIDFEDKRVQFQDWSALKSKAAETKPFRFPWLPVLEIDGGKGGVLSQSLPVLRYVAKLAGLGCKNDFDQAVAESVVELFGEMVPAYSGINFVPAEAKKEKVAAFLEMFNKNGSYLETILSQNNGGKGFFVGNSMSVADVAIFSVLREAEKVVQAHGSALDFSSKPLLKGLCDRVGSNPKIKAYYSK